MITLLLVLLILLIFTIILILVAALGVGSWIIWVLFGDLAVFIAIIVYIIISIVKRRKK